MVRPPTFLHSPAIGRSWLRRIVVITLVVGASAMCLSSFATTLGPLTAVRCPVDGAHFHVRFAKSYLRAPLGEFVRLPAAERTHTCPRCGWVGTKRDLERPISAGVARELASFLTRTPAVQPPLLMERWTELLRSAQLAALSGADVRDVGWRYLQAAGQAPEHERANLLRAAWQVLARTAPTDTASRYVAAELARQLGQRDYAVAEFTRLASDSRATASVRRWSVRGLERTPPTK